MARKSGCKFKGKGRPGPSAPPGAKVNKIERYEDTLEEGGVDDFMFKRDQIMFDEANDSDDEDVNAGEGEEVFALKRSKAFQGDEEDGGDYQDNEDENDEEPPSKSRKEKKKIELTGKGRFGKPVVSSDEEVSESGSSDEDEEGWGRSYYSRPSNRREKEVEGEYDEKREEEKEMEEREVRRLQRKAREGHTDLDDWGLQELPAGAEESSQQEPETKAVAILAPQTTDPDALLRHMESHEPVKLALARDYPLVVQKLEKTAKGIRAMMAEKDGEESLHKGLGWLHYQTLLTYATTLAFYIHLCALPVEKRPDLSSHPILERLLQLKEGVTMLEDLDFAAGEESEIDPLDGEEPTDEDKELAELMKAKKELMARMQIASGSGSEVMPGDDDDEDEKEDDDEEYDEEEDMQNLWHQAGLEDGELADLLADAEDEEEEELAPKKMKKDKKDKKSKKGSRQKEARSDNGEPTPNGKKAPKFTPLEEPTFVASNKPKLREKPTRSEDDILGDPTALNEADATDKERRKRSLQFHTSKIASTSARRAAARATRLGGDEDLPYRDRQAARDAALRKNSQGAAREGKDLDGSEWSEKDKKRAREVREEEGDDATGDGEDYYDLVKRRKTDRDDAKMMAHEEYQAAKFSAFDDDSHEGGPRALTRAIEKNRGLTPRRSKTGRNPRVKKRQAYEKAKQKIGSQRAVFKGGQASLGGSYSGEKTGISQVVKSRKF